MSTPSHFPNPLLRNDGLRPRRKAHDAILDEGSVQSTSPPGNDVANRGERFTKLILCKEIGSILHGGNPTIRYS